MKYYSTHNPKEKSTNHSQAEQTQYTPIEIWKITLKLFLCLNI